MIHVEGLSKELTAAGIQFSGCNSNGVVWGLQGEEIQERPDVAAIITAHNANTWTNREQRARTRRAAAENEARLATQLRTLTPQQAVDYIESNVTNLATAKAAMKIMARLLIALRDHNFPDLPE